MSALLKTEPLAREASTELSAVRALREFCILVPDTDFARLCDFYCEVVGLERKPEPAPHAKQMWLYAAGIRILRLTATHSRPGPRVLEGREPAAGVAIAVTGLAAALARLRASGIRYALRADRQRDSVALALTDPVGVSVELTCRAESEPTDSWLIRALCAWGGDDL